MGHRRVVKPSLATRRRRCLTNHRAAGSSGRNSSDHHGESECGDRGSATPIGAGEIDDAVAEVPGGSVLDEAPLVEAAGVAEGVVLGVPVVDGVLDGDLVGDGALDGDLEGSEALDDGLIEDGAEVLDGGLAGSEAEAAVVGAGPGGRVEPFRVMLELPLL